ncbi:ceramide synthase 6 isoform X1 [Mirounga angustirostris]|uniref:ceramide synthase 6 isoform X2 n=1 Tax=Mirounga leonina TaxID=9715 RepID=UPI00156C2DE8|nr:ceramide synthase 6 isoform X2 [Mirounga leonina]XP_045724634.1 ceramide synthase 6 isoform X2 [Mirounga angustirostris]
MAGILAWFWNERFWLPHNVTWADLKNTEEATFPQAEDLYLAFPLAFCIFMVRLIFERFVAKPCAIALNIQANGPQIAQPNAILEKVFTAITKHPDEKRLEGLSKQLDWDVRSIQRWFRQRCNQEKPSTLRKFCESMWRFSFSLYVFTYGVRFLKKTPWLWNTRHCWYNYPYQPLTTDLHYYYILELSFYWSLMFSQFTDIKRKDFGIMFLHHLVAIFLISFSYVNNMARVGTLVLCLHDSADALLEAAKMANYAKFQKICDLLFVMFAMVFITTRLGIFPLWVLNTTLFESWEIVGPYPSWCPRMIEVILSLAQMRKTPNLQGRTLTLRPPPMGPVVPMGTSCLGLAPWMINYSKLQVPNKVNCLLLEVFKSCKCSSFHYISAPETKLRILKAF